VKLVTGIFTIKISLNSGSLRYTFLGIYIVKITEMVFDLMFMSLQATTWSGYRKISKNII